MSRNSRNPYELAELKRQIENMKFGRGDDLDEVYCTNYYYDRYVAEGVAVVCGYPQKCRSVTGTVEVRHLSSSEDLDDEEEAQERRRRKDRRRERRQRGLLI